MFIFERDITDGGGLVAIIISVFIAATWGVLTYWGAKEHRLGAAVRTAGAVLLVLGVGQMLTILMLESGLVCVVAGGLARAIGGIGRPRSPREAEPSSDSRGGPSRPSPEAAP